MKAHELRIRAMADAADFNWTKIAEDLVQICEDAKWHRGTAIEYVQERFILLPRRYAELAVDVAFNEKAVVKDDDLMTVQAAIKIVDDKLRDAKDHA